MAFLLIVLHRNKNAMRACMTRRGQLIVIRYLALLWCLSALSDSPFSILRRASGAVPREAIAKRTRRSADQRGTQYRRGTPTHARSHARRTPHRTARCNHRLRYDSLALFWILSCLLVIQNIHTAAESLITHTEIRLMLSPYAQSSDANKPRRPNPLPMPL